MAEIGVVEIEGVALTPGIGRLIPAVGACLAHTRRPLSNAALAGLFGHAFESSYAVGGAELWTHGELEWSHHGHGLGRLGLDVAAIDLAVTPFPPRPQASEIDRTRALREAFALASDAVKRGVPALAWTPMSLEQRDAGLGAFNWAVITGVDVYREQYLVLHDAAGRYRVRYDAIGRCDPVNWICVTTFGEPDRDAHAEADLRAALHDAALLLSGERASAIQPASEEALRHGVAALEAFAEDVAAGVANLGGRADYWARTREQAAEFCAWAHELLDLDRMGDLCRAQAEALRASKGQHAGQAREAADLQRELLEEVRSRASS
jgi:hypothetical protein